MKKVLLFAVLLTSFSCGLSKAAKENKQTYFEGIITYAIEYQPHQESYLVKNLKKFLGSKMVLKFKKGSYVKEFYSSNGTLLNERFLDLASQRTYSRSIGNDTIYWYDISKPDSQTTFKRIRDSVVLGYTTLALETETVVTGVGFGDKAYKTSGAYYFAQDLPVNPAWYKNYKEANFDEMIKVGKGMQLIYIGRLPYWDQFITATSVERRTIEKSDITITLAEDVILKEL
ncbi:MAG: hypothetical protein AB8G15_05555 [Saprospiraceae bacterium]